jgi:hypothetical protein
MFMRKKENKRKECDPLLDGVTWKLEGKEPGLNYNSHFKIFMNKNEIQQNEL